MPDKLLTTTEVLEYLNINKQGLIRLIRDEKMPFIRMHGQARFRPSDLKPWLDSNTVTMDSDPEIINIVHVDNENKQNAKPLKNGAGSKETQELFKTYLGNSALTKTYKHDPEVRSDVESEYATTRNPLRITDPYLVYSDDEGLALKIFMKKSAEPHKLTITSLVQSLYLNRPMQPLVEQAFDTPGQPVHLGRIPKTLQSQISIFVTRDKFNAFLFINSDKFVTHAATSENVLQLLETMGIQSGIKTRIIRNANHPDAPGKMLLIASGIQPRVAGDTELIVHIKTPRRFNPKKIEGIKFDLQAFKNVDSCYKDQLLAEIKKPDLARNGVDVYGNVVTCNTLGGPVLKGGPNTYLSSDHSRLHASCSGIPYWRNGSICVDNAIYLDYVGRDSGNVQARGRVIIQGNVESEFSVDAVRKVVVKGQVDAATILSRRSSITVHQGIHGGNNASLTAASNITASFATGCTMKAGMNVFIDKSLVRCNVRAFKDIRLLGQASRTTSSTLIAGRCISIGSSGSKSQLRTTLGIESPTDDHAGSERISLEKQILETRSQIQKHKSLILRLMEQKSNTVNAARFHLEKMKKLLARHEAALETFRGWLKNSDMVFIDVRDIVWPGTVIIIEDKELKIIKQMKSQRFYYTHSGIKHKSI